MFISPGKILTLAPTYKEGDLVRLTSQEDRWAICGDAREGRYELREHPMGNSLLLLIKNSNKERTFHNFEGKHALVVKVIKNRLDQPLGYRVLIGGNTWFCKSIVAEKYFYLMENTGDESR